MHCRARGPRRALPLCQGGRGLGRQLGRLGRAEGFCFYSSSYLKAIQEAVVLILILRPQALEARSCRDTSAAPPAAGPCLGSNPCST